MTEPNQKTAAPPPVIEDGDDEGNVSIVREFIWFIQDNKKWWLIPLILVFVLLAGAIVLSTNPATAPFIYTLF